MLWLLRGQRQVGKAVLDIHTMFFGMIFVVLGMQVWFIGLFAKVFSYTERFDHGGRSLERWLKPRRWSKG